ncbi:MAG: diguanylate cyclase [Bacillota bacterium]
MGILIVDDSRVIRKFFANILREKGYNKIFLAGSAPEAYEILGVGENKDTSGEIDLILLDILLEECDGIEVCRRIKREPQLKDVPVIMVTARSEMDWLEKAFDAGAMDYIIKSSSQVEFTVRVSSALRLREEMKKRKKKEKQLKKLNKKLEKMVSVDGLTGLSNRRFFDKTVTTEWKKAARKGENLSLIMIDIDFFKDYNDTYGHLAGDECLKRVAAKLSVTVHRPGDLIARYGGEEFAVVLPDTNKEGTLTVAERIREGVENLNIIHEESGISEYVTVSLGCVTAAPEQSISENRVKEFIDAADQALYQAKEMGRNTVKFQQSFLEEN